MHFYCVRAAAARGGEGAVLKFFGGLWRNRYFLPRAVKLHAGKLSAAEPRSAAAAAAAGIHKIYDILEREAPHYTHRKFIYHDVFPTIIRALVI